VTSDAKPAADHESAAQPVSYWTKITRARVPPPKWRILCWVGW